jgi:hypothetical protein
MPPPRASIAPWATIQAYVVGACRGLLVQGFLQLATRNGAVLYAMPSELAGGSAVRGFVGGDIEAKVGVR